MHTLFRISMCYAACCVSLAWSQAVCAQAVSPPESDAYYRWTELPDFPNSLGVAGAFVGKIENKVVVCGGANFPKPVWENDKQWTDAIYVLEHEPSGWQWREAGTLPRPLAYGASVSVSEGVLCIGGNDADQHYADAFLVTYDETQQSCLTRVFPSLPEPLAYMGATVIDGTVYVVGGQTTPDLDSASNQVWMLDLELEGSPAFQWERGVPLPGPGRAFHCVLSQHNGFNDSLYVISGRREGRSGTEFLRDVWEFQPKKQLWLERSSAPRCVMAAAAVSVGQSHLFVLGGADGSRFGQADELRDNHPGFPRQSLRYHTITDQWTEAGAIPKNQVTTGAVKFGDQIILVSGEVRPRVRTASVWRIEPQPRGGGFGWINYTVLCLYLASMVGIGVYFTRRNKNTNDYFRGGKHIPWWAAGCSIFATMLSSLTFTGIPSKAYSQDWVYAIGNMMVPVVAFVGVFVALPFYRHLDVTSAYEYLEKRFSRSVRLFGSLSFTLFHLFRMAVVMSLTGLALAVATPLTSGQSVLLIGCLSIAYCTLGGVEAVIWTDTVQAVVLLGGGLLALVMLVSGTEGGATAAWSTAVSGDKLRVANWHWDVTNTQIAFWVIVIGAIGQNISSYTADQAVVQRYMTTPTKSLAARSIWTNAVLVIPATFLFFSIGTALYSFYHSHAQRLDPTIANDQIFPFFIAQEMPAGIAGLIVAGIFAAAQSTVSTSMNSTATTIVTDLLRPLSLVTSESGYLFAARVCTFMIGVAGTLLGLLFIDPSITSLFDAFIKVIGIFMGVLGGLFVLGVLTRRANWAGAMLGACSGAVVMYVLWRFSSVNGYLFTSCGILSCVVVGYLTSLLIPSKERDLEGLTIHTR